jgi:hypothetical protein
MAASVAASGAKRYGVNSPCVMSEPSFDYDYEDEDDDEDEHLQ